MALLSGVCLTLLPCLLGDAQVDLDSVFKATNFEVILGTSTQGGLVKNPARPSLTSTPCLVQHIT
jgi:hypothetical protein